jgi:hypothetical protein
LAWPGEARLAAMAVDTLDRQAVVDLFRAQYEPAFGVAAGWTGNVASCLAGTTAAAYTDATLQMVNYFRAMAGLPANVTFDPALNVKCQEAALMMIAEGSLSHSPGPGWACYTSDGAEAAGKSNLAIGRHGSAAVALGYMHDPGAGNTAVGHRRWILYPRQVAMGTGSNDARNGFFTGANALWVISGFGSRPPTPEWVAWPPAGYVPREIVYPRWSLSRNSSPGADFSGATVAMSEDGQPIGVTVLAVQNGFGDNTLVWEPSGLSFAAGQADRTIRVTVSNIMVGGSPRTFVYDVIVIDPDNEPTPTPGPSAARGWSRYGDGPPPENPPRKRPSLD